MAKETVENRDLLKEKEPEKVLVTEIEIEAGGGTVPEKRTEGGRGQGQEGGEEGYLL